MSSVFEDLDAEKQMAMDRWVLKRLPLTAEQKAELLRGINHPKHCESPLPTSRPNVQICAKNSL